MEPILSKQEIADLLTAIKRGNVPLDIDDDSRQEQFLHCESINLFDLGKKEQDYVRIPNFDIILDSFCRNHTISLSNHLQRTFNITRTDLQTCEYQEFLAQHKDHGCIGIINMPPMLHNAQIIFDRQLSYSMVEIMLGASSELDPLQLERPMTTIELSILKTAMGDACQDIDKAFKPLLDTKTSLVKVENNPRLASITAPEADVLVGSFHVRVDDLSGNIYLVFPLTTLDPLRQKLTELLDVEVSGKDSWQWPLQHQAEHLMVDMIAQSGTIDMTIGSILNLQEGDILPINYDPNMPLKILIENQQKFEAKPGTSNGKRAISITKIVQ